MQVGIIGCGNVGRRHAAIYKAAGHSVCAVADPVGPASQALAEMYEARAYADSLEMIEREPLDLISICSPPVLRLDPVRAAARRGCHVFCEKPMALTLGDAKAMWEAAKVAGIALGMGFKMRFEGAFAAAKRLIEAGAIGEPQVIAITYYQQRPAIKWYLDIGVLRNLLVHTIDLAAWYFGSGACAVKAELHRTLPHAVAEDRAELVLDFGQSRRAFVAGGYFDEFPKISAKDDICFQILGTRGYVAGTRSLGIVLVNGSDAESIATNQGDGFAVEIGAFLDGLARGPSFIPVSGLDGLRAQAVIEASYQSAAHERTMPVPVVAAAAS